jgi:hypothetical protein
MAKLRPSLRSGTCHLLLFSHIFARKVCLSSRSTLPVAEALSHFRFALRDIRKTPVISRVFLKSFIDFLAASGIKKYRENDATSQAKSKRPRVVSAVAVGVLIS